MLYVNLVFSRALFYLKLVCITVKYTMLEQTISHKEMDVTRVHAQLATE